MATAEKGADEKGSEFFEECLERLTKDVLPLVQSFPPMLPEGRTAENEMLAGSMDLILYRNLLFALELCFVEDDSRLAPEELSQLSRLVRTRVIPAYVSFFREHFGRAVLSAEPHKDASPTPSFYFFVRQEGNASWAQLIWQRIRQLHSEAVARKDPDSHELGVRMSGSGVLDVLARLLDIFFPPAAERAVAGKSGRLQHGLSFSARLFEMLHFDLRRGEDAKALGDILQRALIDRDDALSSKNAFYILNRIIAFSSNYPTPLTDQEEELFAWPAGSEMARRWEEFVIVYTAMQEPQVHLVRPMIPMLQSLLRSKLPMAWWRVLVLKGLMNDSVPVRRVVLCTVLSLEGPACDALCTPNGLDFCLEDLMLSGLDSNSAFFVTPQALDEGAEPVDMGSMVGAFYGRLIAAYRQKSQAHGQAMVKELLSAVARALRAPVAIIYVLKAFQAVDAFSVLDDDDLGLIQRISAQPSLHNQRARLVVRSLLMRVCVEWCDGSAVSYAQLAQTVHDLVSEGLLHAGTIHADAPEFGMVGRWLDACFGPTFLRESLGVAIGRFYATAKEEEHRLLRQRAQVLATMATFALGTEDGRFVAFTRPVFEQLALVTAADTPSDAVPAFLLFLTLNASVQAALRGQRDLISQLHLSEKLFDWLVFLADRALFAPPNSEGLQTNLDYVTAVSFPEAQVLLEALDLLSARAEAADQSQLILYLDMLAIRLTGHLGEVSSLARDDPEAAAFKRSFRGILTRMTTLSGLAVVLGRLDALGRTSQRELVSVRLVNEVVRYRLDKPSGMAETEWDMWADFVTAFTAARWQCVSAFAQTLGKGRMDEQRGEGKGDTRRDPSSLHTNAHTPTLLSILASCLQALEVSKYGGSLAILDCMCTVVELVCVLPGADALESLLARTFELMEETLTGRAETQRWFDLYADAFIRLFFHPALLTAAHAFEELQGVLRNVCVFLLDVVGPMRRGIVALASSRLCRFLLDSGEMGVEAARTYWRWAVVRMVLYGPVRALSDELVAARIRAEHVPDSDYQVRVHALTVLNCVSGEGALGVFLDDLLTEGGRAGPRTRKVFPGDGNHRKRLRCWAAILLVVCRLTMDADAEGLDEEAVERLWECVGGETMSSTRAFMELCLARVYLHRPTRLVVRDLLERRVGGMRDCHASLVISVVSVALLVAKGLTLVAPGCARDTFFPLITDNILRLLIHNNHTVRMYAIYAFRQFYRQKCLLGLSGEPLGYRLLAADIEETEHCRRFVRKLEGDWLLSPQGFDPLCGCSLASIFDGLMRHGQVDGEAIEWYAFSNYQETPGAVPFCSEALEERGSTNAGSGSVDAANGNSSGSSNNAASNTADNAVSAPMGEAEVSALFRDFQQKIDIYSPYTGDELDGGRGGRTRGLLSEQAATRALSMELIVVASLVDRLQNLAGLARTCEIFGVRTLYVPDAEALASPDFLSVAMTAERWLDIRELRPSDVARFLSEWRREHAAEGRVVALEQTTYSTRLEQHTFARQTCLVLGNERMGIPAEILHEVDDCVAIPQFGRVRSLNVHVSGAIAVWKAREQDILMGNGAGEEC